MRLIAITGKVDSRALVLPLARALSLTGRTGIVTEDGAYKRLYTERGNLGTVSGVDIRVGSEMNEELISSLGESGLNYENIILVSSEYIPTNANCLIICKGVHKVLWEEKEVFEKEQEEEKEDTETKLIKHKEENAEEDVKQSTAELAKQILDKERVKTNYIKLDGLIIPNNIEYTEVFISYDKAPVKKAHAIAMKEGLARYIANCEEQKELLMYTDKKYCSEVASIVTGLDGISSNELIALLNRPTQLEDKKPKK